MTWKFEKSGLYNIQLTVVDKNGNIKAIGKGTATITATATDGSKVKKTCIITVK